MQTPPIRMKLTTPPDRRLIDARAFLTAVDAELEILSELDHELAAGNFKWILTDLQIGSANTTLRGIWVETDDDPLPEDRERDDVGIDIVKAFVGGLRTLDQHPNVWPRAFTHRAVAAARRLAGVLQHDVTSIGIGAPDLEEWTSVSERVIANAKALVTDTFTDLGSIEGTLVSVSMARRPYTFAVREWVHGRVIQCVFELEQLDEILKAFFKPIQVRGYIAYTEEGIAARVSSVEELTQLDAEPAFDREQFFGLDPDFTDGIPAVEFVSRGWRDREESR